MGQYGEICADGSNAMYWGELEIKPGTPSVIGDITGDGMVDVSDVNAVINIILKNKVESDYPGVADLNDDGKIDVTDVNSIINIILKNRTSH